MPGSPDAPARLHALPVTTPAWLRPGVIGSIASVVEAEVARGTARIAIRQKAWDTGFALFPALPRTHLSEAVKIALWVGKAEDA